MNQIKKIIPSIIQKKLTIATAESCTGGYLAYLLTKTAGSSRFFKGGIIAYTLAIKHSFLKIPQTILKKTNGVDANIAMLMSKNIRKTCKSDIGISTTGYAGPQGSKKHKPGTVFVAISTKTTDYVKKFLFKGGRNSTQKQACSSALRMLAKTITQYKP